MKKTLFALAMISGLALCREADAAIVHYDVLLNGANDGNGSSATGEALLTLDDVLNTLNMTLSFTGLSGSAIAAHIHCCAVPPANAAVVLPFPAFPGTTSGMYTQSFSISSVITADIESGQSYVNIHDTLFPGGEIRGNITAATITPEPATMALVATALTGLAFMRRRNRSAQRLGN